MPTVRPPAVAGLFYPEDRRELAAQVERLLAAAPAANRDLPGPAAVIAPHAGYVYSGGVAARAFTELAAAADRLERVILLGPAHRVPVRGLALPGADRLATPLGEVEVDADLARRAARLDAVSTDPGAHADEHSLEVELPFLQVLLPGLRVLPLVVGRASGEAVAEVLDAVWDDPATAVVVSSDLSHYLPHDTARRIDEETAAAIVQLEVPVATDRACGARAIDGLLRVACRRDLAAELLELASSGDTGGGRERVVGYGAFAFREAA